MTWSEMVLVGRIVRPHGNKGHVVVAPESDFIEDRFRVGSTLWRESGPMTITAMRVHDGRPIVGFDGVDSISAAETLRGAELRVPEQALPVLGAGQFWQHDLIGCRVVTTAGRDVGAVIRIDQASTPILVVEGEVLIPLVESICRSIDVAARRIEVEPIDGLLSLNEPGNGRAVRTDGLGRTAESGGDAGKDGKT